MKVTRKLAAVHLQHVVSPKNEGILGEFDGCSKKFKLDTLVPFWQVTVPEPTLPCWNTLKRREDTKCPVIVPGFNHPHVMMMNDHIYILEIDLL